MYCFILLCLLCSAQSINAEFSLKNIVSYVLPKTQEELVNYDHSFEPHGSLEVENTNGDIVIKTWNQEKIIVEAVKKGSETDLEELDIDARFTENSAILTTKQPNKSKSVVDYTIIVPKRVNVKLKTVNGSITVNQVEGAITAVANKGAIAINEASNSVRAKTAKGTIDVTMRRIKPATTLTLENLEGDIDLALPNETNAQLAAKTLDGKISCDLYVTLKSRTTKINNQFWDAMKREIDGTLGQSGSSINVNTTKGDISITEY
jgi:DUF4097 and DUF4098 domain-containing protein YvlB